MQQFVVDEWKRAARGGGLQKGVRWSARGACGHLVFGPRQTGFGHMHKTQCKWQRIGAQFEIRGLPHTCWFRWRCQLSSQTTHKATRHPPPTTWHPLKNRAPVLPPHPLNHATFVSGSITGCHCRFCHMHKEKWRIWIKTNWF